MLRPLAGISLLAFSSLAGANLIFNGSFETNTVVVNGGAYDTSDGWSIFTDLTALASPDVWDDNGVGGIMPGFAGFFVGMSAYHGTKFASLASNPPLNNFSEGIESTAFNLVANTTYTLSLQLSYYDQAPSGYSNPAGLTARLRFGTNPSGVMTVLTANTLSATWQQRTYSFQVTTPGSYSLILSNEDSVVSYVGVDDVSLDPVPEPLTATIVGLGSVGVLRRRNRAKLHL